MIIVILGLLLFLGKSWPASRRIGACMKSIVAAAYFWTFAVHSELDQQMAWYFLAVKLLTAGDGPGRFMWVFFRVALKRLAIQMLFPHQDDMEPAVVL